MISKSIDPLWSFNCLTHVDTKCSETECSPCPHCHPDLVKFPKNRHALPNSLRCHMWLCRGIGETWPFRGGENDDKPWQISHQNLGHPVFRQTHRKVHLDVRSCSVCMPKWRYFLIFHHGSKMCLHHLEKKDSLEHAPMVSKPFWLVNIGKLMIPWQMHDLRNTLNLPEYPQHGVRKFDIFWNHLTIPNISNDNIRYTYGNHSQAVLRTYLGTGAAWAPGRTQSSARPACQLLDHLVSSQQCNVLKAKNRAVSLLWLVIACISRGPFHRSPTLCWFLRTKLTATACNSKSNPHNPWLFHQCTAPIGSHMFTSVHIDYTDNAQPAMEWLWL
jgi:hypothetical protein